MTDKQHSKILQFTTALQDCYKDEEDRESYIFSKLELCDEELTDDFLAMTQAMFLLYREITGDEETDLIGFTHLLNRIVLQDIVEEMTNQ